MGLRRLSRSGGAARCNALVLVGIAVTVVAGALGTAGAHAQADEDEVTAEFADTQTHSAAGEIQWLSEEGVFAGTECSSGEGVKLFCPEEPVFRWVAAVWIVRALDGRDPGAVDGVQFSDVDADEWWAPHVARLAQLEITRGYRDGSFRPHRAVTNAQAAAFLTRAFDLPEAGDAWFSDIAGSTHRDAINRLAATGVVVGCENERYCPNEVVTRGEMAAQINRTRTWAEGHPLGPAFEQVASGTYHSCAVGSRGTVTCWGRETLARPPAGVFKQITAGVEHTCGLRANDTITCWGSNDNGQLRAPAGKFTQITAGDEHTCGLRANDTVACWGSNDFGETDAPDGAFKQLSAGALHSCGIRTDDTVECWGWDQSGETKAPRGKFKEVAAAQFASCAIRDDDTIACWGKTSIGQTNPPVGSFKQISGGAGSLCAIRTNDTVACWGANSEGEADPPAGTFKQVSAGFLHTCGIRRDDTIACWGKGLEGAPRSPF